jgi:hypothetical protein
LWDPAGQVERKRLPSLARMTADQVAGTDEAEADRDIAHAYAHNLY